MLLLLFHHAAALDAANIGLYRLKRCQLRLNFRRILPDLLAHLLQLFQYLVHHLFIFSLTTLYFFDIIIHIGGKNRISNVKILDRVDIGLTLGSDIKAGLFFFYVAGIQDILNNCGARCRRADPL